MRLPYLVLVIVLILDIVIDGYIYRRIQRFKVLSRAHIALAVILNIAFLALLLWPVRNTDNTWLRVMMWTLFTYITFILPKIIYVLFDLLSRVPALFLRRSSGRVVQWRWLSGTGIVVAGVVFVLMWWGALFNRFNIRTTEVQVERADIPAAFDDFRIAQISDMHLGTYGDDTTFVCNLVGEVNSLHPDIIVFTGDIVNRESTELLPFVNALSRLNAPYGVYSILGNHDYGDYKDWPDEQAKSENLRLLKDMQKRMGWRMLNNDHVSIPVGADTLWLIGVENVGDPPFHTYGDLAKAYPNPGDSRFKILLSHNPSHWDTSIQDNAASNIALTLAGHTHAMQIELFGLSPISFRYKHWGGLYTDSLGQNLYVNIGSGTVGFPARIGANPEITLITLRRSAE